jgi:transcriptional regulator with XRE-family HTH domain
MGEIHTLDLLEWDLRTPPQVSRALKQRRKELGMTQEEAARQAGVSPQWLSGFENGKGSCGTHRMMRLVGVLGLSLALHERPHTDIDRVFESLSDPA